MGVGCFSLAAILCLTSIGCAQGSVVCGETECAPTDGGCCDDGHTAMKCMANEEACLSSLGMWFPLGRPWPDQTLMRCGDQHCVNEPGSTGCCDRGRGYKCSQSQHRCISREGLWHEGPLLPLRNQTCGKSKCEAGFGFVGCCDRGGGWLCEKSKSDCVNKAGVYRYRCTYSSLRHAPQTPTGVL